MTEDETVNELKMFQMSQQLTDEYFGAGAYVTLNGFDPSKGETHKPFPRAQEDQEKP